MHATGCFQGIVLSSLAGSFRENLVDLFYYSAIYYYVRLCTNDFWDRFELYLTERGHELLEFVREMAYFHTTEYTV